MIVIIGGIETAVRIRMMPPKSEDEFDQGMEDNDAVVSEKTVGGLDATGFDAYIRKQRRAMQSDNYWDQVGTSMSNFGGYSAVAFDDDSDISINNDGCGFNVSKILGKKFAGSQEVVLLSALGTDGSGLAAMCELDEAGVDSSRVKRVPGNTAVTVEMRNMMGDIQFMRKSTGAIKGIDIAYIEENKDIIDKADVVFMDGSLDGEVMRYISDICQGKKLYFDPGSMDGAFKYAENECAAYGVMPGRRESEAMTGLTVLGVDQLMAAGKALEEKGVKHTIITLKGGGLYYKEGLDEGLIEPKKVLSFAQTTGAGDVVTAAVLFEILNGKSFKEAAQAGIDDAGIYLADAVDEDTATQLRNKGLIK